MDLFAAQMLGGRNGRGLFNRVDNYAELLSSKDDMTVMSGLQQLCDQLNMSTVMPLFRMNVAALIPPIMTSLQRHDFLEMSILASRVLTYMVDSFPPTIIELSRQENVVALLSPLRNMVDMELSEQCLTCIEKVCEADMGARSFCQGDGISALLTFADFFTLNSQRKIWSNVCRLSSFVSCSTFKLVSPVLPTLRAGINHEDGQINRSALTSITRILQGVKEGNEMADEVFGDVGTSLARVLVSREKEEATFVAALSLISVSITYSDRATKKVVEGDLLSALLTLFHEASFDMGSPVSSVSNHSPVADSPVADQFCLTRDRRVTVSLEEARVISNIFSELLPYVSEGAMEKAHLLRSSPSNESKEASEEDEFEDIDEEAEESLETAAELRSRILEASIPIQTLQEHHRLQKRQCICDRCNRSLPLTNWYHCNVCSNFDLCGSCLLTQYRSHCGGDHSFTDMSAFSTMSSTDSEVKLEANNGKRALYAGTPHFLTKILSAVPAAVRLSSESEVPQTQFYCVEFLARAVDLASKEQLQASGLSPSSVCRTITSALQQPALLTLLAVFLTQKLTTKMPKIYTEVFVREGVVNSMQKLKANLSAPHKRKRNEPEANSTAWREMILEEVTKLLALFPVGREKEMSKKLQAIGRSLQSDELLPSLVQLREVLNSNVTSYEIVSSTVFHELKEALLRSKSVTQLIAIVHLLSDAEGRKNSCPLASLIEHLQSTLTHSDSFQPLSFGGLKSAQSKVNIRLVPDGSSSSRTDLSSRNEDSSSPIPPSHQSANVAVEPLADMNTISVFVAQKLLHSRIPGASMKDDSDEESEDTPTVWLRYDNKILPPSMTTVQLIQHICASNEKKQDTKPKHPKRKGSDDTNVVVLHYSDKPFVGPQFEALSSIPNIPTRTPEYSQIILPSQDTCPSSGGAVLRKLEMSFPWSGRFLQPALQDVLILLATLHEVVLRWDALTTLDVVMDVLTLTLPVDPRRTSLVPPTVTHQDFCHHKLNNKAMRHCSNFLLAGQHLHTWAVNLALDCGFLFMPSTRKFLFDISFCGTVRSIVRMQQKIGDYGVMDRNSADHNMGRAFRLRRVKKRVWRESPLDCAVKFLSGPRSSGSVAWDFEFFDEVGLGSGPTKEFYLLVAAALREKKLNLWRSSDETGQHFIAAQGLYPRLCGFGAEEDPKTSEDMEKYFLVIGRFLARALLDDHVPSMFLSPALLRLLRGECCTIDDVEAIDPSLYQVIKAITEAHQKGTNQIRLSGQSKSFPIEEMNLDFSYGGVSLLPQGHGENVAVNADNMMTFCDDVVRAILQSGVSTAVKALRKGFDDYIPLYALQILSVEELQEVMKGHDHLVSRQEFVENCAAEHGYTMASRPIGWLFDILASFTLEEQKTFFSFLTGSSHLPIGGLSSLHPKLTIVRKTSSEPSVKESDQLPSAMTCQNYLKLPAYESIEQMEAKIRQAMEEGKGSFHLT